MQLNQAVKPYSFNVVEEEASIIVYFEIFKNEIFPLAHASEF